MSVTFKKKGATDMDLHFLGTGGGVPSKERNVSAIALRFLNKRNSNTWLFDCGEATQHQILHTPLKISKVNKIFVTHLHGDHIYGLPGLLGSRSFQGAEKPLTIYGPRGIKKFIDVTLSLSQTFLRYSLQVIEFEDNEQIVGGNVGVYVKMVQHGIPSYGYKIKETDQEGTLQVEQLKRLGVAPGPVYGELKKGRTVTLEDGRQINGKDFIGAKKAGRTLAILGDTRYCQEAIDLAANADVLVHEATFDSTMNHLAFEYFHSTSVQAAKVAKEAGVKTLILTHISSRYQEDTQHLLDEAQTIFPNTYLAEDLWSYSVI
jgi:ribonuclease Z